MITMYDEENQDIELQLYDKDLLDDIDEVDVGYLEEPESKKNDDDDEGEFLSVADLKYSKLTKDALVAEQNKPEKKRSIITFTSKKTNVEYEGILIGQDKNNPDKFVFSVKEINSDNNNRKIKIFKYNELKNFNYK